MSDTVNCPLIEFKIRKDPGATHNAQCFGIVCRLTEVRNDERENLVYDVRLGPGYCAEAQRNRGTERA